MEPGAIGVDFRRWEPGWGFRAIVSDSVGAGLSRLPPKQYLGITAAKSAVRKEVWITGWQAGERSAAYRRESE